MLSPDYIIGLIDGEGSFTVYIRNPEKVGVKRRAKAEPKFFVKLVEDDKGILYKLRDFFGCGHVYFQKDSRKNHKNCYRYEVNKREDIEKVIIPFFVKNRLELKTKAKDFRIFLEIFNRIKKGEHLSKSGLDKLYKLKSKMH